MKIKIQFIVLGLLAIALFSCQTHDRKPSVAAENIPFSALKKYDHSLNFFIISDYGRNGFDNQKEVADQMAIQADSIEPEFIVTCGDNFQVNGVASVQDPLWMSSFENIYRKPSLQVDWYPVFGNHDYKGNTQAEIDYSLVSRRWRFESHYYTFVRKINDSVSARFIFLDTPPMVNEYHKKPGYPDIAAQDTAKQLAWFNKVLANSKEQWKLVFGHHPVFSASLKHGNTQEMIDRVKPLLERYNAQFYFCGHDHDLQHLKEKGGKPDYIVTGTGSEIRLCNKNDLSLFSKSTPAFTCITFQADSVRVGFIDVSGNCVYSYNRSYN